MEERIVIPIHNEDGILVAYAGRSLSQSEPRYRFPTRFRKSLVLFNLHRAIQRGKSVIMVEGFFDCFKVHQAGFPCVVALMVPRQISWEPIKSIPSAIPIYFELQQGHRLSCKPLETQLVSK